MEAIMEAIRVKGRDVVNARDEKVMLRGVCVGGWMSLENFINDFIGVESGLRRHMTATLGESLGTLFFDEMLDNFFSEADAAFIASTGANVVRLCTNYRHFEDDEHPFEYKEKGFARLQRAVDQCAGHGLYVVIDLHAAPGWQNSHWHSDNERGTSLVWRDALYQKRLCALWQEIARRFKDNPAVAGYELINEPSSSTPSGDYPFNFYGEFKPDYERFNKLMRMLVGKVREVDPNHILFFEGDMYAHAFDGLDEPYDDNVVYVMHDYNLPGFGPGVYPGNYKALRNDVIDPSGFWDYRRQLEHIQESSGWKFAQKWNVPLCVGEFGSQYITGEEDRPYRVLAMNDQIRAFNELGLHWTAWSYKDAGVMGWVTLDPECEYRRIVEPVRKMKRLLGAESFTGWFTACPGKELTARLLEYVESIATIQYDHKSSERCMQTTVLGYCASMLQPEYAKLFTDCTAEDLKRIMRSFSLEQCRTSGALVDVIRQRTAD